MVHMAVGSGALESPRTTATLQGGAVHWVLASLSLAVATKWPRPGGAEANSCPPVCDILMFVSQMAGLACGIVPHGAAGEYTRSNTTHLEGVGHLCVDQDGATWALCMSMSWLMVR